MKELRFAMFGAGFWADYQLAGWQELEGIRCVAVYNRTKSKAERLAQRFGVPAVYDDPSDLLEQESLDFVDVLTDVDTHARFTMMAAERGLPVVCQKPLAPDLATAVQMAKACEEWGVPLLVNENWRWQTPIRALKAQLLSGMIGKPFRARVDFITGFPVFDNQPFLRELEQFILTDIGSHILDTARYLFGDPTHLTCRTKKIHTNIKGEDVATVLMDTPEMTVVCNMAYAENTIEKEGFPETRIFIEGEKGSLELDHDFWIRTTTKSGTHLQRHAPPRYPWADPAYDLVHSSIVPCQADLLRHLRGEGEAETRAEDNLKTVRLVFASYESAKTGQTIAL